MRGEVWPERREAATGDRGASRSQGRGLDCSFGSRARGGAHVEHVVHVRDAGGVEVQRLVERMGALPRVARRAYAAVGGAGRRAGGRRRASTVHAACMGRLDCRLGAGHGEERTRNMLAMSVTLEVSKFSGWLNAWANCRESKNGGHTVRDDVRASWEAGRRRANAVHAACRGEGSTADSGQGTGRSARGTCWPCP